MALYNVLITKSASKELEAVPEKDRRRIIECIRGLSSEPRPFGVEKLSGDDKLRHEHRSVSCRLPFHSIRPLHIREAHSRL